MEFFKSVPLYQDFYVSIFSQYVCCCLYNLWKPVLSYDVNLSFADEKTKPMLSETPPSPAQI